MKTIKIVLTLALALLLKLQIVSAQNDTLRNIKNGVVNHQSINVSDVDRKTVSPNTVTDADGNVYKTVTIGTQTWMAENLKTTKYNNGSPIPLRTECNAWDNRSPAYCWYDNDQATYANSYGALYNWYTVNTGQLCPTGWHVPTDEEWTTLIDYLGGKKLAGVKLKETGKIHWWSPNTDATDETGFTALPGGYRKPNGKFTDLGMIGYWYSATETDDIFALTHFMTCSLRSVSRQIYNKKAGFSIRCVRY